MAITDIDTNLLKTSLNECYDALGFSNLNEIISKNMDNSIWECKSRDNLNRALMSLSDEEEKLKNMLQSYMVSIDKMCEYQDLNQSIVDTEKKIKENGDRATEEILKKLNEDKLNLEVLKKNIGELL